jgi:hypothetical protein
MGERYGPGLFELLVVIGIAAFGVLFAAAIALAPWFAPDAAIPAVVHFNPPAPHG